MSLHGVAFEMQVWREARFFIGTRSGMSVWMHGLRAADAYYLTTRDSSYNSSNIATSAPGGALLDPFTQVLEVVDWVWYSGYGVKIWHVGAWLCGWVNTKSAPAVQQYQRNVL